MGWHVWRPWFHHYRSPFPHSWVTRLSVTSLPRVTLKSALKVLHLATPQGLLPPPWKIPKGN